MTAGKKPLACVIGDMDLVRPLGMAGIRCAVVAPPGDPTHYSRFTRAVLEWDDCWKHPDTLVNRLVRWAEGQPEKPVLFYEEDRDLLLVSRYRDVLAPVFRFVVPEATLVEDLVDKNRFQELAERLDLPVPPTRRIHPAGGSRPEDVDLRFPVILKQLTRQTERWVPIAGQAKALEIASAEELAELWPRLERSELELLAQEVVPGPETRIESYHAYVDEDGRILGQFTGRKIRTLPRERGYSTALEITDVPDVAALGREVLFRLGFRGVAKVDFKRAPSGRLYLLEINPRFNLWHHPAACAGVNLPALVYSRLTGAPVPGTPPKPTAGVTWSYLWYDVLAAREWEVPLGAWALWAARCHAKSAVHLDDPMPFMRGVALRKLGRWWKDRRAAPRAKATLRRGMSSWTRGTTAPPSSRPPGR